MGKQTKVAGVILAGGRGSRMQYEDKGLIDYQGQAMASYAISALSGLTDDIMINANRNHDRYQQFGYPVIADQTDNFDGPLAGLLAAMMHTDADILLALPCDSPFVKTEQLQKLRLALSAQHADIAVASIDGKLQPVFLAIKTNLQHSLKDYLASGQRKMALWLTQHKLATVDFSSQAGDFANINTPADLLSLAGKHPRSLSENSLPGKRDF